MSLLKKIVPGFLKSTYHKIRWFATHYDRVNKFSVLQPEREKINVTYDTDGLTTTNNCDFIKAPRFAKAYAAAAATQPWPGFTLQWRVYIVCWFADHVKKLRGDFVECGVNTGAYSRAVIEYINFNDLGKVFYLFDTFEGFPDEQITEAEAKAGIGMYGGTHYKNVYEQVKETFSPFRVKIVKGRVPETLDEFLAQEIAFLSIDMNAVLPEIAAADFFWPKLVSGGVMILDDYGFPMHINQKHAFDRFASQHGVEILSLPTGQGIILKP